MTTRHAKRASELIRHRGRRYPVATVEAAALRAADVAECAAVHNAAIFAARAYERRCPHARAGRPRRVESGLRRVRVRVARRARARAPAAIVVVKRHDVFTEVRAEER